VQVSGIIEAMYRLMVAHDLDLVEINPLGVSNDGKLMALDGKVTVNDRAIIRHPKLQELMRQTIVRSLPKALATGGGRIGLLVEGRGLAVATVVELQRAGRPIFQCWAVDRLSSAEMSEVLQGMARHIDVLLVKCHSINTPLLALATSEFWSAAVVLDAPPNLLEDIDLERFSPVIVSNLEAAIAALVQAISSF
jgi:hypothetical protein